jgi:hypothetical protein
MNMRFKPSTGSRLSQLAGTDEPAQKDASMTLDPRLGATAQSEPVESKYWKETDSDAPAPAAFDISKIGIGQLYVFLLKLFAATLLFALPFLVIYLVINGGLK